MLWFYSVSCWQ